MCQRIGKHNLFTVNLAERRSDLLVRHIDDLRAAMKLVKDAHPFAILAAKKKRFAFARSQNITLGKKFKICGSLPSLIPLQPLLRLGKVPTGTTKSCRG
jgi:hypothetical protein